MRGPNCSAPATNIYRPRPALEAGKNVAASRRGDPHEGRLVPLALSANVDGDVSGLGTLRGLPEILSLCGQPLSTLRPSRTRCHTVLSLPRTISERLVVVPVLSTIHKFRQMSALAPSHILNTI